MADTTYYCVHYEDEELDIEDFRQVQASDAETARHQFEQLADEEDTAHEITTVEEAFVVNQQKVTQLLGGEEEVEFE